MHFPGDIFVLINILSARSEGGLDHAAWLLTAGKFSDRDAELRIETLFAITTVITWIGANTLVTSRDFVL